MIIGRNFRRGQFAPSLLSLPVFFYTLVLNAFLGYTFGVLVSRVVLFTRPVPSHYVTGNIDDTRLRTWGFVRQTLRH